MSDKNFKVKNGLSIQGTNADTLITADNNGGMLIGGNAMLSATNALFSGDALTIPSGTTAQRPASPAVGAVRLNTDQGTLEFYTGTSWGAIATFPQPPRNLAATDVGTSRAFNNASITVGFEVPIGNGGSTVTSYKITSNPGAIVQTVNVPATTATFTGLSSNTNYTFTGTSINSIGEGGSSAASSAVLATSIPQAPTIGTATVTNTTTVSVPFTPGATGGKSVSYTVNSSAGSFTGTGSSSPITVTGAFAAGTAYTFTVTATNANGSATSASSNSITPLPAYALSQTFNNSGNYTVPAGKTQMAVFVMGGGGGAGQGEIGSGAAGGRSAAVIGFKDYAVNAGTTYVVTVGAATGTSAFGNTANTNIASAATTAISYPAGASTADGPYGGNQGNPGSAGASVNLGDANLPTFTAGGSGGGGARPGYGRQMVDYGNVTFFAAGSAGAGGAGGGNGGSPGNISNPEQGGFGGGTNAGGSGGAATQRGGSGGGGGGGAYSQAYEGYNVYQSNGGAAGTSQPGQVLVYVR